MSDRTNDERDEGLTDLCRNAFGWIVLSEENIGLNLAADGSKDLYEIVKYPDSDSEQMHAEVVIPVLYEEGVTPGLAETLSTIAMLSHAMLALWLVFRSFGLSAEEITAKLEGIEAEAQ